jgi:hypothetical protein
VVEHDLGILTAGDDFSAHNCDVFPLYFERSIPMEYRFFASALFG